MLTGKLLARFISNIDAGAADACWPWVAGTDGRYGRWGHRKAHRVAYELWEAPIPTGLVLRHSCDNTLCCNPAHLIPGTQLENLGDAVERGRIATGERNGRTTISASDAAWIRENPESLSASDLGRRFGISKTAAYYIQTGRSWKAGGGRDRD